MSKQWEYNKKRRIQAKSAASIERLTAELQAKLYPTVDKAAKVEALQEVMSSKEVEVDE